MVSRRRGRARPRSPGPHHAGRGVRGPAVVCRPGRSPRDGVRPGVRGHPGAAPSGARRRPDAREIQWPARPTSARSRSPPLTPFAAWPQMRRSSSPSTTSSGSTDRRPASCPSPCGDSPVTRSVRSCRSGSPRTRLAIPLDLDRGVLRTTHLTVGPLPLGGARPDPARTNRCDRSASGRRPAPADHRREPAVRARDGPRRDPRRRPRRSAATCGRSRKICRTVVARLATVPSAGRVAAAGDRGHLPAHLGSRPRGRRVGR